jgi:hypothetical protein
VVVAPPVFVCVFVARPVSLLTMVQRIQEIVRQYEQRVRGMPHVPRFPYGRGLLKDDVAPNRLFLTYVFTDQVMANGSFRTWAFFFTRARPLIGTVAFRLIVQP